MPASSTTNVEAFLSFVQSLTEAAKMSPGVLIVGSLPESDAEAGGERGRAALRRLEQVFGRVQSPWLPTSGDETYEIIRRRLFQPLDADGEKARDETVRSLEVCAQSAWLLGFYAARKPAENVARGRTGGGRGTGIQHSLTGLRAHSRAPSRV